MEALKGLALLVLGWFAPLPAAYYAFTSRHYPWWLVTPDDPIPPFGQYEQKVRTVYERWGPRVGDFYWLGVRNRLYGLSRHWTPETFSGSHNIPLTTKESWGPVTLYLSRGYWQLRMHFGLFGFYLGSMLEPYYYWEGPFKQPNMAGRPICSFRSRKAMKR